MRKIGRVPNKRVFGTITGQSCTVQFSEIHYQAGRLRDLWNGK